MERNKLVYTYDICRAKSLYELLEQVNKYLADGWELQGGVAVSSSSGGLFYQAIKRET